MTIDLPSPDQFLELSRLRRTARQYVDGAVTRREILALAEALRWSPSAANTQPWELIVIDQRTQLAKMKSHFLEDAIGRDKHYEAVTEKQAEILDSAILIAIAGDPSTLERYIDTTQIPPEGKEALFLLTMGAAIQNMLLMATSLGLATTWIARLARIPEVAELLEIKEGLRLIALVAVGRGDRPPQYSENLRIPIARKLHHNRMGTEF